MKHLLLLIFMIYAASAKAQMNKELKIENLSLKDKIGQMILIGFRGDSVSHSESIKYDIQEVGVGSVILFDFDAKLKTRGRNISGSEQLKKLNKELQSISKIPLFISVDEEGGMVSRLNYRYGFQKKKTPQTLGLGSVEESTSELNKIVEELSSHHFNMNFAPLVDVNINPYNPVIGKYERSFSDDEKIVSKFAEHMIKLQNEKKIISVLKHFPGHGSSDADSHFGMVDVTTSWQERELYPFSDLISKNKVDMIMSAHIFLRHIDPDYPATLSKNILTNLLREKLLYNGVIISDDMNMAAIHEHYGLEQAIELSVNAGVDILLFGNNIQYDKNTARKVSEIMLKLVKSKRISIERINESVNRILKLKNKFIL